MKIKSKIQFVLFLAFLSLFQTITNAQVPGYMGKRLAVDAGTSMSLVNPYLFNKRVDYLTRMNLDFNFNAQYVVTRDISIGMSFGYWPTKSDLTFNAGDQATAPGKFVSTAFELLLKMYSFDKTGSIAPFGNHLDFGIGLVNNSRRTLDGKQPEVDQSLKMIMGSFKWGKQIVFFDHMYLDTGASIQLTYTLPTTFENDSDDLVYSWMKQNVFVNRIFRVYVNIGILPV